MIPYLSQILPLLYFGLLVWMLTDCYRREPDRGIWIWVMLLLPPLGVLAYFLARYLPREHPRGLRKLWAPIQTGELKRLKIAALQIGNTYHWLQYADRLRETGRWETAIEAYRKGLEREPDNLPALWGLALCLARQEQFDEALELLDRILARDPEYKFGDVSLARGRLLVALKHWEAARTHLGTHVRRWRQPEGLLLLAQAEQQSGNRQAARGYLEELVMDVESSPPAIARKQASWKRKAKGLLRRL